MTGPQGAIIFQAAGDFLGDVVADLHVGREFKAAAGVGAVEGAVEGRIKSAVPAPHLLVDDGTDLPGPGIGEDDGALVADFHRQAQPNRQMVAFGHRNAGANVRADPHPAFIGLMIGELVEAGFEPFAPAVGDFEGLVFLMFGGQHAVDEGFAALESEVGVKLDHGVVGRHEVGAVDLDFVVALRQRGESGQEEKEGSQVTNLAFELVRLQEVRADIKYVLTRIPICLAAVLLWQAPAHALDLTHATVHAPPGFYGPEAKAVALLVEEADKRSGVRWELGPAAGGPVVEIRRGNGPAEGYRIQSTVAGVTITGNDARGVLYGIGRLLRELRMVRGSIQLPDGFAETSAPRYPLRGHQLGYRPKSNTYDAWSVPVFEQYIRDLAVFGTDAIEIIPPRSDDAADSPHFPLPQMRMMIELSRLLDSYGLDVWVWYPAMDRDYTDPATVEFALREWGEVFRQLPRIDAVFVPGGDPGHTAPGPLMALLAKETEVLHRYHPHAQMWVSPQSFHQAWLDEFLAILRDQQPGWLTGVVFGPQNRMTLRALRAAVPKRYPIRHYPDITHDLQCQFPVPNWDAALAAAEGRESINPRPLEEAGIFRKFQPLTIGFISYSEGSNDDVNKFVWSGLGWNPDQDVSEILRQYSRYLIGDAFSESFTQGLLGLERNWQGSLAGNRGVEETLATFQKMEHTATPAVLRNWRFQQALYRAYFDAYTRKRLIYENALEEEAMRKLRETRDTAAAAAMLDRALGHPAAPALRARIFELAEALFQSIGMQLSVARYQAIGVDRGASLDTVDIPLNNRLWLEARFAEAGSDPAVIDRILHWTDPGPGGFYDDLGDPARQPHLIRGSTGFEYHGHWPQSWWTYAESFYDEPLQMRYTGLDPAAQYRIRVVYAGDSPGRRIRLMAGDREVHPLILKPQPVRPVELNIRREATAQGSLELSWYREAGLGGNGRGAQVAEVWLMKK